MPNRKELVDPILYRLNRLGMGMPKSGVEDFLMRQAPIAVEELRKQMYPTASLTEYIESAEPSYRSIQEIEKSKPVLAYSPDYCAPSAFYYVQKKDWPIFLEAIRMSILQYIHNQPKSATIRFLKVKVKKQGDKVLWKCLEKS
jgi:hypothetical protein